MALKGLCGELKEHMRANDVKATCPTCGGPVGSSNVSSPSDDTAVRTKVHPYVNSWLKGPAHEFADERQLHLKEPMGVVPGWDLHWAHTQHRGRGIVVYQHLGQRQVEFIRITDGDWQDDFLDR